MMKKASQPRGFRLISFVCETDADLLPHFVRWYRRLGVDRFHLVMHGQWSRENLAMIAGLPGVECTRWVNKPFCRSLKCDEITAITRRHVGEWLVFADADEFLELPTRGLPEMVTALETAGVEELYATMLQRVAADGSLPAVEPDSDLDQLFPLAHVGLCEDLGLELPAWRSKYPLARIGANFVYQRGNHLPGNSRSVAHAPIRAVMHHFKWRKSLLKAFEQARGEGTNSDEMAVYRGYLESHGSLPLDGAKPCSRAAIEADGMLRLPTPAESKILTAMIDERIAAEAARVRVGFVTFELGGPGTPNGGIATAISSLAKLQAAHGHRVDVFYCPFHMPRELPSVWFDYWAAFGVTLHHIPRIAAKYDRYMNGPEIESLMVDAVQRAGPFDLLHFHDTQGYAAPFAMLKRAGLQFTNTRIAITTHGGTRWHHEPNGTPWNARAYQQELIGQRLCDMVVSPSAYLIGWNRQLDALPARHIVLPNVLEPESKSFTHPLDHAVVPECLAFFGRVEIRKGFDLFLAALRELAATTDLRPDVLVLGRLGTGYSREQFDQQTAGLPFRIRHFSSLNPEQALRMLKEKTALAIMPSRQENSPYVAYEAMENQLPFLVSFTGGTAELIRREDWPQAELPMEPAAMAAKIASVLRHGLRPARLAIDPLEVELRNLVLWRSFALEKGRSPGGEPAKAFRFDFADWETAAARDPQEIVALVPAGVDLADAPLRGMARLLASAHKAEIVEASCQVVEEETGVVMSSLQLQEKATPREAALLTGPLPVVLRAGVIAELRPALAAAPPDNLHGSLMAAAKKADKCVLPIPLVTHRTRFVAGLEQRAIAARLDLPVARREPPARQVRPRDEVSMLCGLLSAEPFVAISMLSDDLPYGALSLLSDELADRPSLHLITVNAPLRWVADSPLPRRIAEARRKWPLARFRVLAADDSDMRALRAAGLPATLCNLNMFTDERQFHPFRPEAATPTMDAIYIAPMALRDNHFLARNLDSVGLVHHRYAGMDDVGEEVRRMLPRAAYLTDDPDRSEGFFYPGQNQVAAWICQAATGLALNEVGDSCVATAKYLLCGTPVVTVPNVGGRDHFLKEPFFLRAATTPEAVAAAVRELKARKLSREEVHVATKQMFVEARRTFLDDVNAAVREVFGAGHQIDDISGLVGEAMRWRRAVDVLTIRQSPAPRPVAGVAPAEKPAPAAPALHLPLPRQRPPAKTRESLEQVSLLGGTLSDEPFVAISMFNANLPYGALSLFPEALADRPSLHLITVNNSLGWVAHSDLPRRIAEAREIWPLAHFRVLAADDSDMRTLRAAGLPAMLCNLNMFTDERQFHPFRPEAATQTMDAIYIAPMAVRDNHHLARDLNSVGLVHHRYAGMDDVGEDVRRLLHRAVYLNDSAERPEGFFYPGQKQEADWICQAATGLALNEVGDSCVATAKYLLCGTPVVTVPNVGGRDHFLKEPFFLRAATTPEAVAAAVRELKARKLSREEVHVATKQMFVEARRTFLDDVNAAVREVFGAGHQIDDISGLVGEAMRWRRAVDVLTIRQSPAPRPVAVGSPAGEKPAARIDDDLSTPGLRSSKRSFRWPAWFSFKR